MQILIILGIILPAVEGEKSMEKKYKPICTLKENSQDYTIYRNLDNNRFYKEINGNYEKLSLEDGKFYKGIERINDKIAYDNKVRVREENIRKAGKFTLNAAITLVVVSLLGCAGHSLYIESAPKREYNHSEKSENDIMRLFIESMKLNSTLKSDNYNEIKRYLEVFVDECERLGIENDEVYIKIAKQLRLSDFCEDEVVSYKVLCKIFDFRNGKYIAAELYSYLKGISLNSEYTSIASFLYFNDEGKRAVLSGKDVKLDINGKVYDLNLKNMTKNDDELFTLIDTYVDQFVETVEPFSSEVRSNIFSLVIERFYDESELSLYYELQEDGSVKNVSYREYYKKLAELIYKDESEFDYSTQTNRELVYLYIEALRLNFGYQWTDDPVEYILQTFLLDHELFLPVIGSENFLRYLNGAPLELDSLVELWDIGLMGEETLGCLQELNRCLRVEVSLGRLSQESYDYFITSVVETIEILYPERLEEFKDANLYNKPIEGFKLRLIPYYEL